MSKQLKNLIADEVRKRLTGVNDALLVNVIGLDSAKFDPCLKNDETLSRVAADTQEGRTAGVSGTPTFFINGKPLVGAQPLSVFQSQIDTMLGQ